MNDAPLDDPLARLVPMTESEAIMMICVILAAHSKQFPQLRGPGVERHQTDEARSIFAGRLVEHLKTGRMGLFKTVSERPLMMNTGMAKPQ